MRQRALSLGQETKNMAVDPSDGFNPGGWFSHWRTNEQRVWVGEGRDEAGVPFSAEQNLAAAGPRFSRGPWRHLQEPASDDWRVRTIPPANCGYSGRLREADEERICIGVT